MADDEDDEEDDEKASAGGSATAGGVDFQGAVAAFMAVRALAEAGASVPWGLPPDVTIEALRAEVFVPVDDLMLRTSVDGRIYVQSKRSVKLSKRPTSPFGSAVDQFVRLYLSEEKKRPLDPAIDRIVLAAGRLPASLEAVSKVLGRIRDLEAPGAPEECVANDPETTGLEKLLSLVKHFWTEVTGIEPTWAEMVPLLRLFHITVFQLERDQPHEENAKLMLRQSVLHEPAQDNAAWDVLCKKAIGLAKDRSGITRKGLQEFLAQEKISLRVLRSYEPDVITLKSHTKRSLSWLTQFARLLHDGTGVEIPRECADVLRQECEQASLLVIGDAGSGKSGLLGVTAQRLLDDGRDVLVLNAAELAAQSLGTLRGELGLSHDLVDVLEQWHGAGPGFLVIDALDSARDDKRQLMLRQLIDHVQRLNGRWRVVATIRKFELANGSYWRALLPGKGIRPYFDPAYDHVRHLNVEKLTTGELETLKETAPALHQMVSTAPSSVAELVRVPFNLMLAAELLAAGAAADLAGVTTQLQLLDLYWTRRLGTVAERMARERALRSLVEEMVRTRRLEAPAAFAAEKESLEFLLREAVLHLRDDGVQFAHHILFDYAVERLVLRPDTASTIQRLEQNADLAISIGPSLKYWLQGHWERDASRNGFWDASLRVVDSNAPSIAKVIGGTVAAANAQIASDARTLVDHIETRAGSTLFGFAADAIAVDASRVALRVPNPWFEIVADVAARAAPPVVHRATYLLLGLLETRTPTDDELAAAGRAARRMLVVAWEATSRFRSSVIQALRAVGKTFESDVAASAELLGRALEPEHLARFAHEELRWVADEVMHFVGAPGFLVRLYEATFAATASAEHATEMSGSRIFAFISNAEQDLHGAQFVLAKNFSRLVKEHVALAIEIAIAVANGYVPRVRASSQPPETVVISLAGREGSFALDSVTWHSPRAEEPRIIDATTSRLSELAAQDPPTATALLGVITEKNKVAYMWRSVLEQAVGSRALFLLLRETLFQPPLLRAFSKEFVSCIARHSDVLTAQERQRISSAALSLCGDYLGEIAARRLLRTLGDDISQAAKDWLAEFERPANDGDGPAEPSDDLDENDEIDEDAGVSLEEARSELNVALRRQTNVLAEVARAERMDVGRARTELAELRRLAEGEGVSAAYRASAWGLIAEVASRLVYVGGDDVIELLLAAAQRPEPVYSQVKDEKFATSPGWAGGVARIEAVEGVMRLASRTDAGAVLDLVRVLATDPVATVRYQVALRAHWLAPRHPDLFFALVEGFITDRNDAVAGVIFAEGVGQLCLRDPERGITLLVRVAETLAAQNRSAVLLERVFAETLAQYVATGDERLAEIVNAVADDPAGEATRLEHAVMSLRLLLAYHAAEVDDSPAIRLRAVAYVRRVVEAAVTVFRELAPRADLEEADIQRLRSVAKLLAEVTQELFFASLAYDVREGRPASVDVRRAFYSETKDILETLAALGFPAASHYLVQTLATFVDVADPAEVFLLVGLAVRAGTKGGYQYESMAVKEIVAIVERYLADFRAIFVDSEECREALRDVLDIFVDAGWPETHRLVYALDSIYR